MPFFFKVKLAILLYFYIILDFVILTIYISHTNETLGYMDAVLRNINQLKGVFKNAYLKDL